MSSDAKSISEFLSNVNTEQSAIPLLVAIKEGNKEIVKMLIEANIGGPKAKDVALISSVFCGKLDIFKLLIDLGATVGPGVVIATSQSGHFDMLQYIHEKGADIHILQDAALFTAAQEGHIDIVRFLVENGANVNSVNARAIVAAADNGHLEIVKYLAKAGASRTRALTAAIKQNNIQLVRALTSSE